MGNKQWAVGDTVVEFWTVLDINNDPVTGITTPAGITFTLHRQDDVVMELADESVSWTEIAGNPGHYYMTYQPTQPGHYVLQLRERDSSSLLRTWRFDHEIVTAGTAYAPSYAGAFCAEDDVERWAQLTFDSSSVPTTTQVAAFAEGRAQELVSIIAPLGSSVTPGDTISDAVLNAYLRELNAMAAAGDAILAKFSQESPDENSKGMTLLEEYNKRVERLQSYLRSTLSPSLRTHITAGEVTLPTVVPVEDTQFRDAIKMTDEF